MPRNECKKTSQGNSAWLPKLDAETTSSLDMYRRLSKAEIISTWPNHCKSIKNCSRLDLKAFRWLQLHSTSVKIVDTDKNLENAIVSAPWISLECSKWLAKSMRIIDRYQLNIRLGAIQSGLERMVAVARSTECITRQQCQFLLAHVRSDAVPAFRINVKIHKTPVDSRPICNNSRLCLCNAGIFLSAYLRDIVERCPHVITSHLSVIEWANTFEPDAQDRLVVFDIVALYPNLPVWSDGSGISLYEVVSARIWQFYGGKNHNLASLLDSVLHVILSSQFVHFEGSVYEAWQGLNTGLHAASELANVFLSVFDLHVTSKLGEACKYYVRYIDDGLFCLNMSSMQDSFVTESSMDGMSTSVRNPSGPFVQIISWTCSLT